MITESGKLIKFTKNKNCKERRYKSLKVEVLFLFPNYIWEHKWKSNCV